MSRGVDEAIMVTVRRGTIALAVLGALMAACLVLVE